MKPILYFLSLTSLIFLLVSSCKKSSLDGNIITGSKGSKIQFGESNVLNQNLEEASGLELDRDGILWSFGDKGNEPILFGVDELGNPLTEIVFVDAKNNDWEDIALDENDNLLIGNFGNNDNDRDNLKIYWIPNFSDVTTEPVNPKTIKFVYDNQTNFPPPDSELHFDAEAMVTWDNYIYIFTKDRSEPFTGITNLYRLVIENLDQTAEFLGTFNTSNDKKQGAITGADISPSGNQLALLSEERIYLFRNFTAPEFFNNSVEIFEIPEKRKYEGIVFQSEQKLFLVNEKKYGADQQIISLNILE